MARPCSVCSLPNRGDVDQALVSGLSYAEVSRRFAGTAISPDSVERHAKIHVSKALAKAEEARGVVEAAEAGTLLERLQRAHREAWQILAEARKDGDRDGRLRALARVEKQLELEGKLIGELSDAPTVNLVLSPEWGRVRVALRDTLAPFPEALRAVGEALRRLDVGA